MANQGFKRLLTFQDILQFLSRYVKYWRLGVFCATLGASLALAYFVYGKPSYYSKSSVEYSYVDLPIKSEISDVRGNTKWDNIHSQVVLGLQSRWLAERTALRLKLVKNVSQLGTIWSRFISKIKITSSVANQLEIEVWVYEPRLAKLWPQAMLLEYHDFLTESRIKHRDLIIQGFSKEMDRIRENLKAETERDRRFESENRILENFVANNKLEQLPTQMLTYRSQLDAMEEVEKYIDATAPSPAEKLSLLKKHRDKPLAVGTIVRRGAEVDPFLTKTNAPDILMAGTGAVAVEPPKRAAAGASSAATTSTIVIPENSKRTEVWEEIDEKLREAQREYQRLSSNLLPGHEQMRALQKEIDSYSFALEAEWKKEIAAFQLEKDHIRQQLASLQKQMPEYHKLIAGYDDYRRDFRLQSSGRLAWEQAYITMKSRISAMDYTGPEVQVEFFFKGFTEVRDDIPVSPNKQKLLTYALALSLGLGIGGPVLTERLRFTSSFVGEAEKYCQYPACGIVPLMEPKAKLAIEDGKDGNEDDFAGSHAHESFRIIRSSLPFYAPGDNRKQVIMVTSARPSDGKSTVAMHLAKSFAESGDKVLLIDCDLRRGTLHRLLDLDRKQDGLAELLDGQAKLADAIQSTKTPGLSLVARGKSKSVSPELLSRNQFQHLIDSLRPDFDRIIVDTPPLLGLADSLLISKVVDGLIFVIRADQTTQRDVATASEILHQAGAPVYGFVLNCVNLKNLENYYYYGTYYSRYYDPTYYSSSRRGGVQPVNDA
ncbi:polysaccharide biosynthesis tyrosine autokinase [Prosthecobacter vanneervenii]|uniref:Capsular exopolysaccharide synthesis family protein n=1 Tax=Prosthecobacter vanneervenii TaxID=48466 RepID=A0A7W8DI01_9BACT|nr:tyrosine-protein kinase domain-containing protein [Prosthecobacter vanneervenii]MBB5030497.1 capsular exopolysaccharide synthesis family protein [Prosthecobacter vanneervenii]